MNAFAPPASSALETYLDPGEKLLWSGQPKQGVRLQAGDAFMIPSVCCGAVSPWLGRAPHFERLSSPKPPQGPAWIFQWLFPLWGVPFVAMGFYVIFGRFFYDAASRRKTWYGLTDRRLIIVKSLFTRKVTSFDHATMANLNLVERGDHSGDILFGTPAPMSVFANASWPGSGRYVVPGFYLLPEAREIYNRIRTAQEHARK